MDKNINNIVENKKEIDLPKIINSEVNLLVFPFFALNRKNLKKKTKTIYQETIKKGDQKINIIWQVTSNSEYGYPGSFDREVHKAIEEIISEILKEKGKIENPIALGSLYNLCKKMGISKYAGINYRLIKEALERIRATTIKSIGSFYSKEGKQWVDDNFSLYERIVFKGKKLPDNKTSDDNYLYLGSWYLQSLNSFYIKPIDYSYLQSLESKIASRLYEILGVKFYGLRNKKDSFLCYKYSKLCQLLPVTRQKYYSLAKQQLDPGNEELKNTGFISQFKWSENGKKDWLLYYWPGARAKKEMKDNRVKQLDFNEDKYLNGPDISDEEVDTKKQIELDHDNDLINKLIDLNIYRITASRLVKKYNNEMIKDWVRAIDFANADDKAAYIVKAIKENWQLPEEYLKEKESAAEREGELKNKAIHEKEKEDENKRKQEENLKLYQIYKSLDPVKQKEIDQEAENRLDDFWKTQLNKGKSKGKLSKILEATLEEKRREIIKKRFVSDNIKM